MFKIINEETNSSELMKPMVKEDSKWVKDFPVILPPLMFEDKYEESNEKEPMVKEDSTWVEDFPIIPRSLMFEDSSVGSTSFETTSHQLMYSDVPTLFRGGAKTPSGIFFVKFRQE